MTKYRAVKCKETGICIALSETGGECTCPIGVCYEKEFKDEDHLEEDSELLEK